MKPLSEVAPHLLVIQIQIQAVQCSVSNKLYNQTDAMDVSLLDHKSQVEIDIYEIQRDCKMI